MMMGKRNILPGGILFLALHAQSFLHHAVPSSVRGVGGNLRHSFDPDMIVSQLRNEHGLPNATITVLSNDPELFVVDHFLSNEECRLYRSYVAAKKSMTRSNPPEVSLETSKLWPLALLAVASGLPPLVRLYETKNVVTPMDVLLTTLPNIVVASLCMVAVAWLVVLPLVQNMARDSSRTSVACALNEIDDLHFIYPLLQRACWVAQHPPNRWEAPVVTRYDPGAIFSRHGDASPTRGSEWKDLGGQRIVTCICYLNTLESGGETYFDKLDIAVRPRMGSALFFRPADAVTWKADDRTTHESLPADTEKWIVQLFGRAETVPPPLGLPNEVSLESSVSTKSC